MILVTDDDWKFCASVAGRIIFDAPADVKIPLKLDNQNYLRTVFSIRYMIDNEIDKFWGLNIIFQSRAREFGTDRDLPGENYNPEWFKKIALWGTMLKETREKFSNVNSNIYLSDRRSNQNISIIMPPKNKNTEITLLSEETINQNFLTVKGNLEEKVKECKLIKTITTDEEASKLDVLQKDIDKTAKAIETARIDLKAPYLATGNQIDAAAKIAKGEAEGEVVRAKKLLVDFSLAKEQAQRKINEDAERLRQQTEATANKLTAFFEKTGQNIIEQEEKIYADIIEANDRESLTRVWDTHIKGFVPTEEQYGTILKFAEAMKTRIQWLANAKKALIQALIKNPEDPTAKQIFTVEKGKYNVSFNEYKKELSDFIANSTEEIVLNAEVQKSNITQNTMQQAQTNQPVIQTRRTIAYSSTNMVDLYKMAPHLCRIEFNEEAMKKFIADQGEIPAEGVEFNHGVLKLEWKISAINR